MGIDANGARFLAHARSIGVDFSRTLMIGRQNLYIKPEDMRAVLAAYGDTLSPQALADICEGGGGFSENLFRRLGARDVDSLDYSPYQDATHVHDMNTPIPASLKERYTAVLDGGSLEHIFNFPVAIRNCMEMVEVGGRYLAITPANNFFGHGFYQFSPELYFTVFAEENGFEIEQMIAFEETRTPVWHAVKSPREVRGRVTLCNSEPVYLLVIARRIAVRPIFETPPQQSDYTVIWDGPEESAGEAAPAPAPRPLAIRLAKLFLPARLRQLMRAAIAALAPPPARRMGFDPAFFTPMRPPPARTSR